MKKSDLNRIKLQLLDRRNRLSDATAQSTGEVKYLSLLKEVDAALERMDNGAYGVCVICQHPIEENRLAANPLVNVCLDHLDEIQRRSLETDLDLAHKIQNSMLPQNNFRTENWEAFFHYEPAGAVSGDYCDIITVGDKQYFILGDVSGKGVAAALLMSQMHAMFHSMIPLGMELTSLFERASRLMCESTMYSHYATLLCVKAEENGSIEVCNAGHLPPLLIKKGSVKKIDATGMPVGLFCDTTYTLNFASMESGDTLLLYSDGLTESFFNEEEYGIERIEKVIVEDVNLSPESLTKKILNDVEKFVGNRMRRDDLTIMTIRKI